MRSDNYKDDNKTW